MRHELILLQRYLRLYATVSHCGDACVSPSTNIVLMVFYSSDPEPLDGVGSGVPFGRAGIAPFPASPVICCAFSCGVSPVLFGRTSRQLRPPPWTSKILYEGTFICGMTFLFFFLSSRKDGDKTRSHTNRVEGISGCQMTNIRVIRKRLRELDPESGSVPP